MDPSFFPLLEITAKNFVLNLLTRGAAQEYDISNFYASGSLALQT